MSDYSEKCPKEKKHVLQENFVCMVHACVCAHAHVCMY